MLCTERNFHESFDEQVMIRYTIRHCRKETMNWIIVNEKYLDYLRNFENRIPYSDYGKNKYKPFFGVLFETNDLLYITQISHAQPRHQKMKQQKDFYKIYDSKQPSRLLAVINLNYMFPVPQSEVCRFEKKKIDSYRTFSSEDEKSKYIDLLDRELAVINTLNLSVAALEVYKIKYSCPDSPIARRSLDYKKLEKHVQDWINNLCSAAMK